MNGRYILITTTTRDESKHIGIILYESVLQAHSLTHSLTHYMIIPKSGDYPHSNHIGKSPLCLARESEHLAYSSKVVAIDMSINHPPLSHDDISIELTKLSMPMPRALGKIFFHLFPPDGCCFDVEWMPQVWSRAYQDESQGNGKTFGLTLVQSRVQRGWDPKIFDPMYLFFFYL